MEKLMINTEVKNITVDYCWTEKGAFISIETLEKFIKESKEKGANYLELLATTDYDNDLEDVSLVSVSRRIETDKEFKERFDNDRKKIIKRQEDQKEKDLDMLKRLKEKYE